MNGTVGIGFVALTVGLAPVPADPPPDPHAWGYLGVRVIQGTLRIEHIDPGTPAAKAGLRPNDEFIKVGDLRPATFDEVAERISGLRPGTTLQLEIRRGGKTQALSVRLGVRPEQAGPPPRLRLPLGEPLP